MQIHREVHSTDSVDHCSKKWLVSFYRLVISYANDGRIIPSILGEGVEISKNWATTHSLVF